jgi:5'-nucleotidase
MTYILVVNDDGIDAPGIYALVQALKGIATDIQVVAPMVNQSASGHKKTLHFDMRTQERQWDDGTRAVAVDGSPADCIALAALGIVRWPPRLVVSGINRGANMGQDVTYSGTVSAAMEATIQGIPAVAVSLDSQQANDITDYEIAGRLAARVVARALVHPLPPFTILSLNVPYVPEVRGIRLTRQGVRIYHDELETDGDIRRIVGQAPTGILDEAGTDLWCIDNGYASLTPLHLDLTAHQFMADLAAWDLTG